VSYVDGFDNPIGVTVLNGSCVSPSSWHGAAHELQCRLGGRLPLEPCTRYNTDQFCCRGVRHGDLQRA
jgi:hypothetical protein